jgi:hypothetical protein
VRRAPLTPPRLADCPALPPPSSCFEFSARHGLEWWQVDMTWYCIRALQALGLATNVKLPSEKQKAKFAFPKPAAAAQ